MTTARLWTALAILLPILGALIAGLSAVDLAYHVRAGDAILRGAGIPRMDTWTFTANGEPWLDQQWGAQAFLALVHSVAGWSGLFVVRAALVGSLFALLIATARLRGASARRAAWLALGAFFVTAVALALRPQLLGMLLFAVTLALLAARSIRPRFVFAIPVVVAVWANVHGSFVLGPLVVGLAWLEDGAGRGPSSNRLLVVAAASAIATLVNPFGVDVWRYAVGLSTNPEVTRRITEWQPTSLRDVPGLLFFGSVAVVTMVLARSGRRVPWVTLLVLAIFVALGIYAVRGVAWWPIVAVYAIAPIVGTRARPADAAERPTPRVAARANGAIVAMLGVAIVALLPWWRPTDPAIGAPAGVVADAPPGITATLRSLLRPDDRLLNPQPWGSWFEYAFMTTPVAIDSRIELFPPTVWSELETIAIGAAGWQDVISRWAPTVAVLAPSDRELQIRLEAVGWQAVASDRDGMVLTAPGRR